MTTARKEMASSAA